MIPDQDGPKSPLGRDEIAEFFAAVGVVIAGFCRFLDGIDAQREPIVPPRVINRRFDQQKKKKGQLPRVSDGSSNSISDYQNEDNPII